MTKKTCNIFWFRRDLRLNDNVGLYHALKSDRPVLCLFIFDKDILSKLEDKDDQRLLFIHTTLSHLKEELKEHGSDLLTYYDKPIKAWEDITATYDVQDVYCNEDYEPYALQRDEKVAQLLEKQDIDLHSFKDQCIFAKNDILKNDGKPYTVYTPYKRKWRETVTPKDVASINNKKFFGNFFKTRSLNMPTLEDMGFVHADSLAPQRVIKTQLIKLYHEQRDIPALQATSKLGLHLRFGTVSPRKCAQVGFELNDTWLDELIWREFFMQILYHFPHVEKAPFKEKYEKIPWINDKKQFEKWCQGMTGYPIVDAGMRELNATGHMHNRVRMITASFLVKHLLIDWRWGERYFARKLLDFELSANNGNWQWVAGTGCDAAPYFRVFNPETQMKKFDPKLEYVKHWVPEYGTEAYPEKMIEHKFAYNRARETYKEALS